MAGFLNHLPCRGGGRTGPHPKNQTYHHAINLKRKFCMSHSYRTIPDAKFEFGIISIFGDMTPKLSLSKWGEQVIEFVYLPPGNGFKL